MMNTKLPPLILSLLLFSGVSISAQTQLEMNQTAQHIYEGVEHERAEALAMIRKIYADEAQFLTALTASENAWEVYRDAFMESLFPGDNKRLIYGSVYPLVYHDYKTTLTRQHIETLSLWLQGKEEGDMGLGSVYVSEWVKERKALLQK